MPPNENKENLDPLIMVGVALGLADGQLEQADHLLGGGSRKGYRRHDESLLTLALLHARSACGWLIAACEAMQSNRGKVA